MSPVQRRDWPDRTVDLEKSLAAISNRLRAREVLRAIGVAAPCAAILALLLRFAGLSAVASVAATTLIAGLAAALWLRHVGAGWNASVSARRVEAAHAESRNIVITAEELLRHPHRAGDAIRQRVIFEAAEMVGSANPPEVVPLRRPLWGATLGVLAAVTILTVVPGQARRLTSRAIPQPQSSAHGAVPIAVTATVDPPAYTHEGRKTMTNPERIDALQGSRLTLTVRGGGPFRLRFGSDALATQASGDETRVELALSQSGYIAIEPMEPESAGMKRLLPIAVVADRAPTIRIDKPGRDLLLPHASQNVELSGAAADDFGMQSLELRYTKVTGSGEQFEFNEGTLPLSIARESGREWRARAVLALRSVGLAPGDALIYRLVGRDERPGDAGLATSDTYFIEIAGPGQVALTGFELPPDRERYALSQQMIVLKLERLRAKEKSIDRASLEQEAGNIAAEQRAVRANFVFLMGGEVEDEEAEAEHSHEIQEGRLENTARREIVDAIQHMGKVEIALAAVDTGGALPPARAAVDALQRAFGRNRYILRTLPVRSRIDPSKRLSGDTSSASSWGREVSAPPADAAAEAARALLGRLLELSPALVAGTVPAAAITGLAENALSIDAAAADWQQISRSLLQLRDTRGTAEQRSAVLNQVVGTVSTIVARSSLSTRPVDRERALRSAWAEERGR
jgi:hypothetical protein